VERRVFGVERGWLGFKPWRPSRAAAAIRVALTPPPSVVTPLLALQKAQQRGPEPAPWWPQPTKSAAAGPAPGRDRCIQEVSKVRGGARVISCACPNMVLYRYHQQSTPVQGRTANL
jgi:hypothetical protein